MSTSNQAGGRLAAIMFTDMVGYSALCQKSESLASKLLEEHRTMVRQGLAHLSGREIDTTGDGFLLEFGSAVQAVQFAVALQKRQADRNASVADDHRFQFRIGIHLGEIETSEKNITGDGVNIAARLEPLSPHGGLAISAAVHALVRNRSLAEFRSIGTPSLKNISSPVEVFVVDSLDRSRSDRKHDTRHVSICVLPFANISGDPEQEYFSDGITEDIITDLSKVSALSVVSRNTSFTFKGKAVDIAQVGRSLKVTHVLEGSVRKAGNRVRITAQLISAADDSHLWAERYDRELADIFALQDEISAAIVAALKLHLLPEERKAIESRSTTNPDAYKLYLMARQYQITANFRHRDIIVRLCRKALEIDPNYARAWAMLAITLSNIAVTGGTSSEDAWPAAEKALSLDPNLAEAHSARGRLLGDAGRYAEAEAEHELALRLDPDSYDVNAAAARNYMAMHRHRDAIRVLRRASEVAPADFWAPGMTIATYEALGDTAAVQEAAKITLERVEKVIAVEPDHGSALSWGVGALIRLGQRDRAIEWMERALLLDPDNTNRRFNSACGMVNLKEYARALELLQPILKTCNRESLEWFKTDLDLDPLRENPRFKTMMAEAEARLAQAK